jgi:hypothetical protein
MYMSQNRNRAKFNKAQNSRVYRILWINEYYPPYWDDGINLYPRYNKGFIKPNKQIYSSEVREYRTWKHNRKTQWK